MSFNEPDVNLTIKSKEDGTLYGIGTASFVDDHPTTDNELQSFGMNDDWLKEAIKRLNGDCALFVARPNQYGRLFTKVESSEEPTNIEILQPTTSFTCQGQENQSNNEVEVTLVSTIKVSTSLSSTMENQNQIEVSQEIKYGISFFGGSTTFSYSYQWGQSTTSTQEYVIGSENGVKVKLANKGDGAYVTLSATQATLSFNLVFTALLKGEISYSTNPLWPIPNFVNIDDLINVMKDSDQPKVENPSTLKQYVKIPFFANVEVIVYDYPANNPLQTMNGDIITKQRKQN